MDGSFTAGWGGLGPPVSLNGSHPRPPPGGPAGAASGEIGNGSQQSNSIDQEPFSEYWTQPGELSIRVRAVAASWGISGTTPIIPDTFGFWEEGWGTKLLKRGLD